MKICVFGAGSIGGHLAARLANGGAEVCVVARGDHLAAIRRDGLAVETSDGELRARVAASNDPHELGPQDVVIVTVKAPALQSVADTISPLLGTDTPVVFAINGIPWWYFHCHGDALDGRSIPILDPDDALKSTAGLHRVIGAVIYGPATVVAPGRIRAISRDNRLILGEPNGALSERTDRIAATLRQCGIGSNVSTRIRDDIWSKLLHNLAASSLTLLAGVTVKEIYQEADCREAGRRIMREGEAIACALGSTPALDVERALAQMQGFAHKPSALQDLELGRPVEVDALFVVPLQLARMLGVPTPTLDLLTALIKLRLGAAGLYRDCALTSAHVQQIS